MEKKYIDAEAFKRRVMESAFEANKQDIYDIAKGVCEMVDCMKSADVAPVVHGEWDVNGMYMNGVAGNWKCSVCRRVSLEDRNYCPNCGAKMDGDEHGAE